jgi:hypothetical protein
MPKTYAVPSSDVLLPRMKGAFSDRLVTLTIDAITQDAPVELTHQQLVERVQLAIDAAAPDIPPEARADAYRQRDGIVALIKVLAGESADAAPPAEEEPPPPAEDGAP